MSDNCHLGRKSRRRERRLMKGFNFDFLMMGCPVESFEDEDDDYAQISESPGATTSKSHNGGKSPAAMRSKFTRMAQNIASKRRGARWRQLIEATRNKMIPFSRSQDSIESAGNVTADSSQPVTDSGSLKFDANLRRQIFALKLDTVSLSQPVLKTTAVNQAMDSMTDSPEPAAAPAAAGAASSRSRQQRSQQQNTSKLQKLATATHLTSGPKPETTMIVQKKTSLPVL